MRAGPNHPLYAVRPNQAVELPITLGFKTRKDVEDAIDALDTWAKMQNHFTVREFSRDYLETFLIGAKGSTERAKQRIDKRCTFTNLMPEMFSNINIKADFKKLFQYFTFSSMPICTKDYYRISISKLSDKNKRIQNFNLVDIARYLIGLSEYNMLNEYVYGFEVIIDMQDMALTDIITKLNPIVFGKIMIILQEGYGCRLKAIHLIYDSKFVETVVAILKQGLSEKLGNRIQVHNNHETLHKFIDKECLPSDYGGTGPTLQEVHDRIFKEISKDDHIARLKEVEHYATDETKRLSGKFIEEYTGMPGSFRTLSVD